MRSGSSMMRCAAKAAVAIDGPAPVDLRLRLGTAQELLPQIVGKRPTVVIADSIACRIRSITHLMSLRRMVHL
jgi:hypothetical protein